MAYPEEIRNAAKGLYLKRWTPQEIKDELGLNSCRIVYYWAEKLGWRELLTDEAVAQTSAYFFSRPTDMLQAMWDAVAGAYSALFRGSVFNYLRADDLAVAIRPLTETLANATPLIAAGLGVALAILPLATALGFIGLAIYGSFLVLILLEATNRAIQRGLTRPARETLFTVVGREDKYKAKAFIDTFVYRLGDVLGAQIEAIIGRAGTGPGSLLGAVIPLTAAWALLAIWLGRRYRNARQEPAPDIAG